MKFSVSLKIILLLFLGYHHYLSFGYPSVHERDSLLQDSLLKELSVTKDIPQLIENYCRLIRLVYQKNLVLALQYEASMDSVIQYQNHQVQDHYYYFWKGNLAKATGKLDKSLSYYDQSIALAEEPEKEQLVGTIYLRKSLIYIQQNKFAEAMQALLRAETVFQNSEHEYGALSDVKNNMALIYYLEGNMSAAEQHFKAALSYLEKVNDSLGVAELNSNLGVIAKNLNNYEEAIAYYKQSLTYYRLKGLQEEEMGVLSNIGSLLIDSYKYEEALIPLQKAFSISKQIQLSSTHMPLTLNLSEAHLALGRPILARGYALEAVSMADSLDFPTKKLKAMLNLVNIEESLGNNSKALAWMNKAYKLKHSINQKEKKKELAEIQTKYNVQEQKKENQRLLQDKKAAQFRTLMYSLILLVVSLAALFLFWSYYKKNQANTLLKAQQAEIRSNNLQLEKQNERLLALNQEKNFMVGMLAHDLRSPLANIEGLSNIIAYENEGNAEHQKFLRHIKHTAQSLSKMSQRLLDLEAFEKNGLHLNIESVDMGKIIVASIESYFLKSQEKHIKIIKRCESPHLVVTGDEQAIRQVVDNLLSNAIKFSPLYSEVTISTQEEAGYIQISIKDQGPGILKADMHKLFQKYQKLSNKPTGGEPSTGLGLALVKKYVDAMQGNIHCSSQPGKGSTFTVSLPKA